MPPGRRAERPAANLTQFDKCADWRETISIAPEGVLVAGENAAEGSAPDGATKLGEGTMNKGMGRLGRLAAITLLIWSVASLFASDARAADAEPAAASEVAAESAGSGHSAVGPDEMQTLRQRLESAETQIQLLKSVVIQALRGQSAAEEALEREREARDRTVAPGAGPDATPSRDLMIADHLEALTESLALLREDVAALRVEALGRRPAAAATPGDSPPSAADESDETEPGAAADDDDPIADSGVGGAYDPLLEDESAALDGLIEVGLVHFDTGSASLSPGAERKALEAADRIKAMEALRVRVVGHTDTVGEAGFNRDLSTDRARSIATVLEFAGLPVDSVEIVGSGEDEIPVPTSDQVSEPLNRCAAIFVVMDSPK
jgi:outer membrane protein OmpA-like peptidoglycan-associated protein